jgi:YfiR/HmsC-like
MKPRRPRHGNLRLGSSCSRISPCGSGRIGRSLICIVVGVLFLVHSSPAPAQSEGNNEYQVKLAFLYNFAQFVEWPADTFRDEGAPLAICVAGNNPFQGEIEKSLSGRTVAGHPVEVRRLNPDEDPNDCQMIFVRATEKKVVPRLLASSKGSSTLTVGEATGFAERGGIINFTREEDKLRFEVNLDAAAQTRLRISSKLLALARIVKK